MLHKVDMTCTSSPPLSLLPTRHSRCTGPTCRAAPVRCSKGPPRCAARLAVRISYQEISSFPPCVNWHLVPNCNYRCQFCFATFEDLPKGAGLGTSQKLRVLEELQAFGCKRVNFAGGEPTLDPDIHALIKHCKDLGMGASLVTNGSRLSEAVLVELADHLDVIAFSVDAGCDSLHALMRRGLGSEIVNGMTSMAVAKEASVTGTADPVKLALTMGVSIPKNGHIARVTHLWPTAQKLGYTLKINTVVNRLNLHDDMIPLIAHLAPARWKVFQALPVEGQNSGAVDPLLISNQEYAGWVQRHEEGLAREGLALRPTVESNDVMRGSYAMLDTRGCFYTNIDARGEATEHVYGRPILEVGASTAWGDVSSSFNPENYVGRSGVWSYGQGEQVLREEAEWAAAWASSHASVADAAHVEA